MRSGTHLLRLRYGLRVRVMHASITRVRVRVVWRDLDPNPIRRLGTSNARDAFDQLVTREVVPKAVHVLNE